MTRKGPPVHEGPSLFSPRGPTSGRTSALVTKVWLRSAIPKVIHSPILRLVVLVLLMGIQSILLVAGYQLVDLCIQLAELWVDLARKHLEITL